MPQERSSSQAAALQVLQALQTLLQKMLQVLQRCSNSATAAGALH